MGARMQSLAQLPNGRIDLHCVHGPAAVSQGSGGGVARAGAQNQNPGRGRSKAEAMLQGFSSMASSSSPA